MPAWSKNYQVPRDWPHRRNLYPAPRHQEQGRGCTRTSETTTRATRPREASGVVVTPTAEDIWAENICPTYPHRVHPLPCRAEKGAVGALPWIAQTNGFWGT